jgi:hypothetical protein
MNSILLRVCTVIGFVVGFSLLVLALQPISAQEPKPWKELFKGKDLTGWTISAGGGRGGRAAIAPDAPPGWKVEDGALVGGHGKPGERTGSLSTVDRYRDFELDLDFMLAEQGTQCSEEFNGRENASVEKSCCYNGGIIIRTGYQVNLGRREAGEYIGVVTHRAAPGAIRGNVLWLGPGDKDFPGLRKREDWNHLNVVFRGDHMTVTLNGTKICDFHDDPVLESEAGWKEASPISFQYPSAAEGGGFAGFIKFKNIRIREF